MGSKPQLTLEENRISMIFQDENAARRWYSELENMEIDILDEEVSKSMYSVCMLKYFCEKMDLDKLREDLFAKLTTYSEWLGRMASDYPKLRDLEKTENFLKCKFSKTKSKSIKKVDSGLSLRTPATIFDTTIYITKEADSVSLLITNYNKFNETALMKLKTFMGEAASGNQRYVSFKRQLANIALNADMLRKIKFDPEYPIPQEILNKIRETYGDQIDADKFQLSTELKVEKDIGRTIDLKSFPEIKSLLEGLKGSESILEVMGVKKDVTFRILEQYGEPMKIILYPSAKELLRLGEYDYLTKFITSLGDTKLDNKSIQVSLFSDFKKISELS